MIDESEAVAKPDGAVAQARKAHLQKLNAVPVEQRKEWVRQNGKVEEIEMEVWDDYYNRYVARLRELDEKFDFSEGMRNIIAVDGDFVDRDKNILKRVSAINVREGSVFGIRGYPANAKSSDTDQFYAYDRYAADGTTGWGPLGKKPALLPYANVTPGSTDWRTKTRHVIIDDASALARGSPSVSSEAVSGIDPLQYKYRGHLIANRLGGPGRFTTGNIVPMNRNANQSEMPSKLEIPVRQLFENDPHRGDPAHRVIVDVRATPQNWNPANNIPLTIAVGYQQIYPVKEPEVTDSVTNS
jgi:hypothetical protein